MTGGPHACWPWLRSKTAQGYGVLRWKGKTERAHRVALGLSDGNRSVAWALHHCDNRACCNPLHLYRGDASDNVNDMIRRGRKFIPAGDANGSRTKPQSRPRADAHWTRQRPDSVLRGETVASSKLTECDAIRIRKSTDPIRVLSERYGVTSSAIGLVKAGKTWGHLVDTEISATQNMPREHCRRGHRVNGGRCLICEQLRQQRFYAERRARLGIRAKPHRKVEAFGLVKTISEWSRILGTSRHKITKCVDAGLSLEDMLA